MINVAVIYHSRPTSKLYMPSVITVHASQFPNLSATEKVQLAPQLDYDIYVHVSVLFIPNINYLLN